MNNLTILTWKYFIEQKVGEIKDHLEVVVGFSIFLAFILIIIGLGLDSHGKSYFPWLGYLGISIFIFWLLVGIIWVIKGIIKWLLYNWKKAKKRALQDIKNG